MVTDTTVRDEAAAGGGAALPWWIGIFERVLSGQSTLMPAEKSDLESDRTLPAQPEPHLRWFQAVMENLDRLPWGVAAWSSEDAQPLIDEAVARLLFLLQEFLPPDGPAPVISPTWDGGVQADWELGDLYLELEVVPSGLTRCCFVDERGAEMIEEEFELHGNEATLRVHISAIATAASASQ